MQAHFAMTSTVVTLLLLALGLTLAHGSADVTQEMVVLKERGDAYEINSSDYDELHIFCHPGVPTSLAQFWTTTHFKLQIHPGAKFDLYVADNATAVKTSYSASSWPLSSIGKGLSWKTTETKLDPFQETCLGVVTSEPYVIALGGFRVNYWLVTLTFMGIGLFLYAPTLCRNVLFHYMTGIGAGILFSLLAITYIVQRRMRTSWMGWIMGFYSLSVYFLTTLWMNFKTYAMENHVYVLGYLVVTGALSFAFVYRMGPVENPRTLDLIQWSLQAFALFLIFISSHHQTASLSLALVLLTWASISDVFKTKAQVYYRKKFPPKVRLLNETEYMDEARIETERALAELRDYCQSPKCDAWKLTSRLQSPSRFAEFVAGSPHLTENEVMDYSQTEFDEYDLMDDDDDSEVGEVGDGNEAALTDDDGDSLAGGEQ